MATVKKSPAKKSTAAASSKTKNANANAQPYFNEAALKFLRGLKKNNDREWFNARKQIFEGELKEPMLAVIRKVTDAMLDFAPAHVRPAEKSLFRIYRDTRFSNDKRPYKTHIAAWWVHTGMEKTSGAGFYLAVDPTEVVIAGGAYMPQKEQLAAIRHWLLDHHAQLRKLMTQPAIKKHFTIFEGEALTRPPKGFPAEHDGMDLIRCRQWGLRTSLPAAEALKPGFAALVTRHFEMLAPFVEALNTPLLAAAKPKKPLLFGLK
jgi:uncharacterized protein (TIGR02453 family)